MSEFPLKCIVGGNKLVEEADGPLIFFHGFKLILTVQNICTVASGLPGIQSQAGCD